MAGRGVAVAWPSVAVAAGADVLVAVGDAAGVLVAAGGVVPVAVAGDGEAVAVVVVAGDGEVVAVVPGEGDPPGVPVRVTPGVVVRVVVEAAVGLPFPVTPLSSPHWDANQRAAAAATSAAAPPPMNSRRRFPPMPPAPDGAGASAARPLPPHRQTEGHPWFEGGAANSGRRLGRWRCGGSARFAEAVPSVSARRTSGSSPSTALGDEAGGRRDDPADDDEPEAEAPVDVDPRAFEL